MGDGRHGFLTRDGITGNRLSQTVQVGIRLSRPVSSPHSIAALLRCRQDAREELHQGNESEEYMQPEEGTSFYCPDLCRRRRYSAHSCSFPSQSHALLLSPPRPPVVRPLTTTKDMIGRGIPSQFMTTTVSPRFASLYTPTGRGCRPMWSLLKIQPPKRASSERA